MLVHVPDTSFFAPGQTFVISSDAFSKTPDPANPSRCQPPECLALPTLRNVTGSYSVTRNASTTVGYPLEEGTSIPVTGAYQAVGDTSKSAFYPDLSLDKKFLASKFVDDGSGNPPQVKYGVILPPGKYARVLFPEPPFDEFFPPAFFGSTTADGIPAQLITQSQFSDGFLLGGGTTPLDDDNGGSRTAVVTREGGLDGFRVWLADEATERRISVVKTLTGKTQTVRLDTTGENPAGKVGLGDNVEAIVAPPDSYTAVPRYVSSLQGGQGLRHLVYPSIPAPVAVSGVVAEPSEEGGTTLLGYPAALTFDSSGGIGLTALGGDGSTCKAGPCPLLQYSTSVATDDSGRFATVLPPGAYRVTIEPAEGTGFAKTSQIVNVAVETTTFTLQPPPRPLVTGRVVLTDDRPLSEAEIIAYPQDPATSDLPKPRPGRTQSLENGQYSMELDPGPYVITVVPKAGTGFPSVVRQSVIPLQATDLPDLRVPAPTRLSFQLVDSAVVGNPIVRAIVRILALPAPAPTPEGGALAALQAVKPIEIGSAMTDPDGQVEILLAQQPR
jgi:hypothetical protein